MAKNRARPTLSPRKRPTQERARRTYHAILEAGARILERQGYEALTTNHVADLAGVGIASLYEYFPEQARAGRGDRAPRARGAARGSRPKHAADHHVTAPASRSRRGSARCTRPSRSVAAWSRVIVQEVPFLWEIPAVESARTMLFALARSTRELGASVGTPPLPDAMIYLLATMTGAAVLEAVLRPPPNTRPRS